jgi:hypothetical protein
MLYMIACTSPQQVVHVVYEIETIWNTTYYKDKVRIYLCATMVLKSTWYVIRFRSFGDKPKSLYNSTFDPIERVQLVPYWSLNGVAIDIVNIKEKVALNTSMQCM